MLLDTANNKTPAYQGWMTVIYDKDLNIVDIINPQSSMMLQLTSDILLGINVSDVEKITEGPNKEPAKIIAKNVRKAFDENRNIYFEYSTTHKDNTITYAICYAERVSDDHLYVNVLKIDEENIFEARDVFTNYVISMTINNISVGIYMCHINDDGAKKYVLFNDVVKDIYGVNDIQQSQYWNQEEEDNADEEVVQNQKKLKIERVFRYKNGDIARWFIVTKKKIDCKSGGYYIITTIIDITRRRQNEILLEQQLALLDSIYKHMPVGIVIYDKYGDLVSYNHKVVYMFDVQNKEDDPGLNIFDVPSTPNEIKERLRRGENVDYEVKFDFDDVSNKYFKSSKTGKLILSVKSAVIKNKNGDLEGYLQICEDITESYNYRIELERSRNDLNLALEAGNVSAWIYNVDSNMFSTLQGDTLAGNGISMTESQKILHPDDRQMQLDLFNSIIIGEKNSASAVFRYILPDGKYHHFESRMIATVQNNRVITITGTQKDITEEIEYKQELMRLKEEALLSNQILNQIIDNIPSVLDVRNSNDDYRFVLVNKGFCEYFGRSLEDVIGHKDTEIFDPRSAEKSNYYDKLVVATGESYSYHDYVTLNGKSCYWRITKSPLNMANGDIYTVCVATDITEIIENNTKLKITKKETESANKILNEIIDHIQGGICIKDTSDDFRYLKVNKAFCKMVGKSKSEIVGYTDFDIFDYDKAINIREYDLKLKNGETDVSYSKTEMKDGNKEYWQINKSIITSKSNNDIILAVASNVTKYIEINKELERSKTKAEESDRLKSAFLANMSHEIRTPLNAIVGFSELLHTVEDEQEKAEYIRIINQNNDMLLRLIGDILDLSKIESGLIELKPEEFDVSDVFNETFTIFNNRCTNSDIELKIVNPYNRCIVKLDKSRMLQVLTNFLTNAIKYTSRGEIIMGYEYVNKGLRMYVKDTGIGIPKDKQQLLFRRFAKLDDFAQGTGLGLAICKAIIDAKGGNIGCESDEGKGSTFWAWIPCEALIEKCETGIDNSYSTSIYTNNISKLHNEKVSILVAEDNDSNYLLVKAILKNYKLTRAKTGAEAVALASENSYDAILMDMRMPVLGGLEATREIRKFDKEIPIIALTANAFDSDKVDAMNEGCNAFISKPLKKNEIEDLLNEILR